jgi:hypothetical protein
MLLSPLRFAAFAAGIICIGAGCAIAPSADAQGYSTFQSSCGNIGIDGDTVFAVCRRVDGSPHRTSIMLQGIENIDGQLQFTGPGRPASFQDTCHHIRIVGSTVWAECRRVDGSYRLTSINLPGIANNDGHLQYGEP